MCNPYFFVVHNPIAFLVALFIAGCIAVVSSLFLSFRLRFYRLLMSEGVDGTGFASRMARDANNAQWPSMMHRTSGAFDVMSSMNGSVEYKSSVPRQGGTRPSFSRTGKSSGSNVYTFKLSDDVGGVEMLAAKPLLHRCWEMRDKYKSIDKGQVEGTDRLQSPLFIQVDEGVFQFTDQRTSIVKWETFYEDVLLLLECVQSERIQAACRYRLQVLEEKYHIYKLFNGNIEESERRSDRGGGIFAHAVKVDNCISMDTMMNAQWLVDYIVDIFDNRTDDVVALSEINEPISLSHMLEVWDVKDTYLLTPDGLGLQPSPAKPSARYDALNPDLNSGGRSCAEMLQLFLSRETHNGGTYFADVVRSSLLRSEAKANGFQATETVIEITGLYPDEWEKAAEWVEQNELSSIPGNTYVISFNRQKIKELRRYDPFLPRGTKINGDLKPASFTNHQQHFDNLFFPLFLATISPEDPKSAAIANLLNNVGGFMIVFEDEDRVEAIHRKLHRPADIPWEESVGDVYFAYHVWANICSLNSLRHRRNLNTFQIRAVAGSQRTSTNTDSLVVSYLFCDSVVNGLALENQTVLQYLYGTKGIGVSMYPLTNNGQGVPYMEHPFPTLFRRGLRVSLSTMHPLFYHHSKEALVEEYGTASKLYRLSSVDISEIALNSVMMSTFSRDVKASWLGEPFMIEGIQGNSFELSFVPTARLEFRNDAWLSEIELICPNGSDVPSHSRRVASSVTEATEANVGDRQSVITFEASNMDGIATSSTGKRGVLDMDGDPALMGSSSQVILTDKELLRQSGAPFAVVDPAVDFPRLYISGAYDKTAAFAAAAHAFHRALELRSYYTSWRHTESGSYANDFLKPDTLQIEQAFSRNKTNFFDEDEWTFKTVEGVVVPHEVHQIPRLPKGMYHFEDFRAHVEEIHESVKKLSNRMFAEQRLKLLEHTFNLHTAVNHSLEAGSTADKASQNRDFYQSTRVDNSIRMETGMTARQLLDFIVSKAHNNGDDIVSHQSGKEPQTLRQLLSELKISPDSLTVDDLNVQAKPTVGIASDQYTPEGRDELLALLLKTDNQMKGRYFAELTKLTFENLKRDRFTFTENRLPVYGASAEEWALVSTWFDTHGMSSSHNQWMIQIPRIYGYLRKKHKVSCFAEYLENIFRPLWSVSLHPHKDPRLFHFVNHISGFDCIEDERRLDVPLSLATRPPHEWTSEDDPPYNYYMYHIWANIFTLNEFRRRRQFSTFSFRPSSGESGQVDHLIGAFLLSNGISYGVQLGDNAPLQYLFYLAQIGVAVSPLSNNTKVLDYLDNPFPLLFRRGLMVTLGTDSPLMYHHTQEPLLEEYSIANKIWKLSPNDMCEISRNSVILSGFSHAFKQERLGKLFFLSSSVSNDASRTHLSDVRVAYRFESYHREVGFLEYVSGLTFQRAMLNLAEEEQQKVIFLEQESMNKKGTEYRGIIDLQPEQNEIKKLLSQRNSMESQLEELMKTMLQLQQDNKLITEKLVVERTKEKEEQFKMRNRIDRESSAKDVVPKELLSDTCDESRKATSTDDGSPHAKAASSFSAGISMETLALPSDAVSQMQTAQTTPLAQKSTKGNPLLLQKETLWTAKPRGAGKEDKVLLPSI